MKEIWKDIQGFDGYTVSNLGRVKSLLNPNKDIILKQAISTSGYNRVFLRKDGSTHTKYVHRLVAKTFLSNSENKREINHLDGNKLKNWVSNLEWCTSSENSKHALNLGLLDSVVGKNQHSSKFKEKDILKIRSLYAKGNETYESLAEKFGTSFGHIGQIVTRKRWKHI